MKSIRFLTEKETKNGGIVIRIRYHIGKMKQGGFRMKGTGLNIRKNRK